MPLKVQAYIPDTSGDQVVVTTADMTTKDGGPCVVIDHGESRLIVEADALAAAIQRARIDRRFDDDPVF